LVLVVIMSRQSNNGSPVPSPIDIDTPDGSILGADLTDNETQYTYQWNEKQQQLINDYKKYHYEMMFFVDELEKDGPEGKSINMPKKPKGDLSRLLGDHKQMSKLLSGKHLHKYLVEKRATQDIVTCPKVSDFGLFTSLENILEYLKSGYEGLKKQNSTSIAVCIDYGDWLNVAFQLHYIEKLAGKISVTWKEWLKANVDIQDSYARKLREVAELLGKYPKFRTLGLPFSEIYQRRKQIKAMLETDRNVAQYWQQAN